MAEMHRVEIIEQDGAGWLVRITSSGVRPQEYYCATREQADNLAAVMSGSKVPGRASRLRAAGPSSDSRPPPLPRQQTRK